MKAYRIGERSNSQLQWEYLTKNGQILLGFWCNFQKAARERRVGSTRLRLMPPPRTAC